MAFLAEAMANDKQFVARPRHDTSEVAHRRQIPKNNWLVLTCLLLLLAPTFHSAQQTDLSILTLGRIFTSSEFTPESFGPSGGSIRVVHIQFPNRQVRQEKVAISSATPPNPESAPSSSQRRN
jgi:hypothetical protein